MPDTLVLGAGMVGVTTALALQERGHDVCLIDRRPPGCEASYGNAGIIQLEVMEPYAFPRAPLEIAKIAMGIGNDIHYRINALPGAAPALIRYYYHSAPKRLARAAAIYRPLIARSGRDHQQLIAAAGAEALIRPDGYIQMHRDAHTLAADVALAERYRREFGIASTTLDPAGLRALEPGLRSSFAGALHWHQSLSCRDPGGLVTAYAKLFEARGGTFCQAEIRDLSPSSHGWSVALRGAASQQAASVVVALGAWSPDLLARFGLRVPMVRKRGYHQHFASSAAPRHPLFDTQAGALYCPMQRGVRVTTGAEIARFGSRPGGVQLNKALKYARATLDLGAPVEPEPWSGWRPCLPDMVPVVGAVPGQPGLWCNFGHGHQGFTLGPTSAQVLAGIMTDQQIEELPEATQLGISPARFAVAV